MAIVHSSAILDPEVRKRALARIGYFDDTTKRGRQVDYRRLLDWFMQLVRKNLATMRTTELRELREEVRALQEEGAGGVRLTEDDASTAAHLPTTQATVAQYVERLTKTGRIEFEAFTLITSILLPRFRPGATPSSYKHPLYFGESVEPDHGKGLLYLFYLALKGAGDRLRQCRHCTALFVQARRKQQFCTARCRVRALRTRQQKERDGGKTRTPSAKAKKRATHGTKAKKGAKHGTKRREHFPDRSTR